jgi:hypothetical protein
MHGNGLRMEVEGVGLDDVRRRDILSGEVEE